MADVLHSSIVSTTEKSYSSVVRKYVLFCELHNLEPWPVDAIQLCAWIIRLLTTVKPTSLGTYLAGVRYVHINHGYTWTLTGNEYVRRTLRWAKRNFPCGGKALKVPITVAVLRAILPKLKGWPDVDEMSYDDLLCACASVTGVLCFLRGGECLSRRGRPAPSFSTRTSVSSW